MWRNFVLFLIMLAVNTIWVGVAAVFQPEWVVIVQDNVFLAITLELMGISCAGFGFYFLFNTEKPKQ